MQSAQAQNVLVSEGGPMYLEDSLSGADEALQLQNGTEQLQDNVLMKINDALVNGSLSISEASKLKEMLNRIDQRETAFISSSQKIPAPLIERDKQDIAAIATELQGNTSETTTKQLTMSGDVGDLISKALAKNHISSKEAEQYYMRLGQIESDVSKAEAKPSQLDNRNVTLTPNLDNLRAEVAKKVY
jgi:hypothetical protein